jgi:hypothetical protein
VHQLAENGHGRKSALCAVGKLNVNAGSRHAALVEADEANNQLRQVAEAKRQSGQRVEVEDWIERCAVESDLVLGESVGLAKVFDDRTLVA